MPGFVPGSGSWGLRTQLASRSISQLLPNVVVFLGNGEGLMQMRDPVLVACQVSVGVAKVSVGDGEWGGVGKVPGCVSAVSTQ